LSFLLVLIVPAFCSLLHGIEWDKTEGVKQKNLKLKAESKKILPLVLQWEDGKAPCFAYMVAPSLSMAISR
jgi:hypothetical protein